MNNNNRSEIDPYDVLKIPHESTLEEIKEAYRNLAMVNHPDRGGSEETYTIIKLAFKMIVDSFKKGIPIQKQVSNTFVEMKSAANSDFVQKQPEPHEFFGQTTPINPNKEFNRDAFNQKFLQNQNTEDYLLSSIDKDYRETRTKEQLLSEQANIENELGQIQPLFKDKDTFNNGAFQRMFEHLNGNTLSKAVQNYEEPQALVSSLQPFTEIDESHKVKHTDNFSSLCFSNFDDGFNAGKNPDHVDQDLLNKFAQEPDITIVNTIEEDDRARMKNKMNEYNSININFHPKPADPNQLPKQLKATHSTIDKVSQEQLKNVFSQKLQERNDLLSNLKYGVSGRVGLGQELGQGLGQDQPTIDSNRQQSQLQPQPHPQPQPQPQPQKQSNRDNQVINRNLLIKHQSMPIMDYPKNSNVPYDEEPRQQSQTQTQPQIQNDSLTIEDYFVKIPNANQNPQQIYRGQNLGYNQSPQQFMLPQVNQNTGKFSQLTPQYQMPTFQNQPPQINEFQKQLEQLQKTVQEQNKMIKALSTKKKCSKKTKKTNK
jgi:curved DNA-binding protein CbpA